MQLEQLAIDIVSEEFDIPEDMLKPELVTTWFRIRYRMMRGVMMMKRKKKSSHLKVLKE